MLKVTGETLDLCATCVKVNNNDIMTMRVFLAIIYGETPS